MAGVASGDASGGLVCGFAVDTERKASPVVIGGPTVTGSVGFSTPGV